MGPGLVSSNALWLCGIVRCLWLGMVVPKEKPWEVEMADSRNDIKCFVNPKGLRVHRRRPSLSSTGLRSWCGSRPRVSLLAWPLLTGGGLSSELGDGGSVRGLVMELFEGDPYLHQQ